MRALARPSVAKAIRDREEERDRAFYERYGMGYEEYLDYAEQEMVHVLGNLSNFDEEKYLQEHAVEITNQIDKEHGKGIVGDDSAGEEPVHGAGGEVLHREGSDESGGGGALAGYGEGETEVRGGHNKDAAVPEVTSGGGEEQKRGVDDGNRRQDGSEKSAKNKIETPKNIAGYGTLSKDVTDVADLPTDMAYRETDINELEDILETGYMRRLPEGKTVEGASHSFKTKSGRSFSIGKVHGNSHGGKGFAKGAPWSTLGGTLSRGTANKVIIGIPGNIVDWRVGHHGSYKEARPFDEIEHGKPLWIQFDEEGDITDIGAENIRVWVSDAEGNYHEFIPSKNSARPSVEPKVEGVADPMVGMRNAAEKYNEENGGPKRKISEKVRSALESIAEDLGYKVVWHDTLADNGYIDYKKKEIHIAKDAENPLDAVFGHESTHAIRKSSEAEYIALRDAVKRLIGEEEWNNLIMGKREEGYKEAKLEEEVTGDVVGSIFHDKKMAEGLARELKGDPGIIAKIREIWHKIIDRLKSIGAKEELKQTENALAAFEAVVHAFKTAKANSDRLTPGAEMHNDKGDVVARVDDAGNIDFNHRTYKDFTDEEENKHKGTRNSVIEHLEAQGMKKSDIKKFVDNMDYWYDLTGKVAELVDKDGNFLFDSFHTWSQTSPLYKRYEGNIVRAISTLVTNGEYPLNFELSTDCIKREAFTQIINEMVNIGGTFWKKLTPEKIQELRTLQKSYGIQVACPLCFVEGKRLNIMKWAMSVSAKWNEALKRVVGNREVTPFGFGDGTFVPDTPYDERTTPQSVVDQINAVARIIGDHDGVLPADLARMQANTKAMEDKLQGYYEEFVSKHGSGNGFSLTKAQVEELCSLRGKNSKDVIGRMVSMIATHPELQHTLDVSDLVGSKGLTEIRKRGGEAFAQMYSLIISANGTGTPKVVQDAQPYSGEIIDVSQNAFDKADKIGGARLFSFSDFDITKVFDIMQIMWDCAARNARVQSYSKEIPYILIFGKSGVKINMSMLPEARPAKELVDAYKNSKGKERKGVLERIRENAGLEMDGGKIVGMQLSDSHSVSREFAESIYRNPEYNANCGAVMVGVSANHSLYAMLQGYIRQVIPFHLSGMPISARRATDCQYYRDFTNEQNTGVVVNGRRVKAKWGENTPVKSDFNFYENEGEPGWNMRQRARDYVKWCADNGLVPRFEWAVNSQAYP